MKYRITHHALERARMRFGVDIKDAEKWANDLMKRGRYVCAQAGDRLLYRNGEYRILVDTRKNTIITVYKETNIDFLRPTLEREIRKIRREYTRNIRALERSLAGQYARLAEQMTNYANARNPQTRELVGDRMEETERHIEGTRRKIERMKDEVKAKVKAIEVIAE